MPAKAAGILDQVSGYWVAMAGRGIQQEKKKNVQEYLGDVLCGFCVVYRQISGQPPLLHVASCGMFAMPAGQGVFSDYRRLSTCA